MMAERQAAAVAKLTGKTPAKAAPTPAKPSTPTPTPKQSVKRGRPAAKAESDDDDDASDEDVQASDDDAKTRCVGRRRQARHPLLGSRLGGIVTVRSFF